MQRQQPHCCLCVCISVFLDVCESAVLVSVFLWFLGECHDQLLGSHLLQSTVHLRTSSHLWYPGPRHVCRDSDASAWALPGCTGLQGDHTQHTYQPFQNLQWQITLCLWTGKALEMEPLNNCLSMNTYSKYWTCIMSSTISSHNIFERSYDQSPKQTNIFFYTEVNMTICS